MKILFGLFLFAACGASSAIFGVEERDWMNDWQTPEVPGTEQITAVTLEAIDNYSVTITYSLDGGRFGDQLVNYIKALWVCWKYDLPMLYRPFSYSDDLVLSEKHTTQLNAESLQAFSKKIELAKSVDKAALFFTSLDKAKEQPLAKNEKLLCVVAVLTPFFEQFEDEKFEDENFKKLLKEMVRPKVAHKKQQLPTDCISVAIHVRTGVGYDWQLNIDNMPTKFPADTFYLNGLKVVSEHFKEKPLYVQIFTDDPHPEAICTRFLSQLQEWEIDNVRAMECCRAVNTHDQNVLEDFFAMTEFDCLIHPDSYFTRCVGLLSAPVVEVKPPAWGIYRKDQNGNALRDRRGHLIVDAHSIFREAKGKAITKRQFSEIAPAHLF